MASDCPSPSGDHVPGQPGSLPALRTGDEEQDPAEWAQHLTQLPFPCVRSSKSALLQILQTLRPQREPMIRHQLGWDSSVMHHKLSENVWHVEAAYMFMVGRRVAVKCVTCLLERGIFPFCVVVNFPNGHSECANCHWYDWACSIVHRSVPSWSQPARALPNISTNSRGGTVPGNTINTSITEEMAGLLSMYNVLRADVNELQRTAAVNTACWNRLNVTVGSIISPPNHGRTLRRSDCQDTRRACHQGETGARDVQSAVARVTTRVTELNSAFEKMERLLRELRRE